VNSPFSQELLAHGSVNIETENAPTLVLTYSVSDSAGCRSVSLWEFGARIETVSSSTLHAASPSEPLSWGCSGRIVGEEVVPPALS
jgi:hypothetical protein